MRTKRKIVKISFALMKDLDFFQRKAEVCAKR